MAKTTPQPDAPSVRRIKTNGAEYETLCTDAEAWAWLQSDDPAPPGQSWSLGSAEVVR